MKSINNLKEKRLLVSRKFIIKKIEPTDENINSIWGELFPSDKMRMDNAELFEWIRKHIASNGIESCDKQLANIRRKGEKNLKSKGKYVKYGAKLIKQPKDALATYNIFTIGKKYSGNYESLCRRIGTIFKESIRFSQKKNSPNSCLNLMISNCTESRTFAMTYGICILFFILKIY